jgi:WD40 repeat protein
MRWRDDTPGTPGRTSPLDFFISYSPADERWATWVAWQLETAGHRTMLQAWDFVPGTNFIEFMDRGVRDSAVVVAVLSRNYLNSRYGTMEWQAALRTDHQKLVTLRIDDCPLEGLLATITYLDLLDVADPATAADVLLGKLHEVLAGRAKPPRAPGFPSAGTDAADAVLADTPRREAQRPGTGQAGTGQAGTGREESGREYAARRRAPATAPPYPATATTPGRRSEQVTVLHVPGPRFGRGVAGPDEPLSARDLQARIWANVTHLADAGAPHPDLIVVTGDLTESARPREKEEALNFLTGLRVLLGLESERLLVVPGRHDVSKAACQSYWLDCEARETQPQQPYFPKLVHYTQLFEDLYEGLDGPLFDVAQPWTLYAVPELRVAIAGLNSTMAQSHRPEDDHGWIGESQAAWFAKRLREFENSGWLRIGLINHQADAHAGQIANEPRMLRDVDTLDRLLGQRLNLLLHGPGSAGSSIDRLGSGLPVVPASGPGQEEIIQITADGLRRFSVYNTGHNTGHNTGKPAPLQVGWTNTSGTFAAAQAPAVLGSAEPEPGAATPTDLLLDRIEQVCHARYERVGIRRVDADPPHLLLTRQDDGFNPQWRIGAHVGAVDEEALEAFLRFDPEPGSELVYEGPAEESVAASRRLRDEALRRGVRLRSFIEFQGLLDLRGYVSDQLNSLYADRRYPPDLYVPQRYVELDRSEQRAGDDLAEELLRLLTADLGRFVLLLGDFGRGKTFVLHEVARRITESFPLLIPILIDLRALDKAHSVYGLVAAHLANHGEEVIDLKALDYMLREGRIVLLFDGFDELVTRLTYDRAADHLDTLLQAAQDKAKIVVASRTQHFKSHAQVFTALGERVGLMPNRRILGVENFTPAQIRAYLVNRYRGDEERADARLELINNIQDLLGLSRNPRMLSFISDLEVDRLHSAARARSTVSAAGLYREILNSWLAYEEDRALGTAGSPMGLRVPDLWQAVTTLALRLWEAGDSYLRLAELTEVAETLSGLAEGRLSIEQTAFAVGRGSLLVRTDEGLFGFIHESVVEWLVANVIAEQLNGGAAHVPQLRRRPLSPLTVDFLCDLAEPGGVQAWANAILADAGAGEAPRDNALKVLTRLRTPPTADLRGASLRGNDLSYRELRGVDLTGADLTGARLVGANLNGAILRDAKLVGTWLGEAQLAGADLRGADLTSARLPRADLSGARISGSKWSRAALINAVGVPEGAPELRDAAVAPGDPVETEFAPASVGVRHGFHAALGRLPQVLDYSTDGSTLAIGSDDGGVLICDTASGAPLRTLQGHSGRVFLVTYGEDVLITGSNDGTVRIWDPATGKCRHVLRGHEQWSWPVALSPSGRELATGDAAGVLRMWDIGSGRLLRRVVAGGGLVFSLAFSGSLLAATYQDGSVLLADAEGDESRIELTGASGSVYRVAFSPHGDLLATGGQGGAVRLWSPATGRLLTDLSGHTGRVYTLAFHPSEPLLASGDTDGNVRVWDTAAGALRHELSGHHAAIYWVAFSPDGTLLATGDSAGAVRLWDATTGQLRHTLSGHTGSVWPFVFRGDSAQLAISDDQYTTRLWDTATGQCRHTLTGHGRQVTWVRFSGDGSKLATSGNDGVVRLWHPASGRLMDRLIGTDNRLVMLEAALFSPDGRYLVTVGNDGRLNLLNLAENRYERHIDVQSAPIWAVAFSPSGEELATANDDDTVRIWYRTTGRLVHTLAEHRGRVRSIAFSADGSMIATGCDDSKVRLWDAESGELISTLSGHTDRVYAVDFAGDVVASASWDGTARIWEVPSGQPRHELALHRGKLWTAAFDPSGKLLATAGDDLVIRLWDPITGQELHDPLTGHTRSVWSLAFSPDGTTLATGSDDGTTRLWSLTGERPGPALTLLGPAEGWAALAPDGRYKLEGDLGGLFWHVIGMCRFETGELDRHLPQVRQITLEADF